MPIYPLLDEKELLRLIAEGDEKAFGQLFERYWDRVFSTALLLTKSKELAEDIAQEVFTRIWVKRVQLTGIENTGSWFFIIARNLIYGRLRKEAIAEKYRRYIKEYFSEGPVGPDTIAELSELDTTIRKAILQLPPQQQKAFQLSRYKGLSHEEIAHEMGISRATVKAYIVQSIATLRKVLASHSA